MWPRLSLHARPSGNDDDGVCGRVSAVVKLFLLFIIAVLMLLYGFLGAPMALDALQLIWQRGQPAHVLHYRLAHLSEQDYETEVRNALAHEDPELARSVVVLASEHDMELDGTLVRAVTDGEKFSASRIVRELWKGGVGESVDTPAAFAAALAADATVIGDARDLAREAIAYPDHDKLTVALAATGIGMTALSITTAGAALPGKLGLSIFKAARKGRKFSKPLERELLQLSTEAIDGEALTALGVHLKLLAPADIAADARRIVKPEVASRLMEVGTSVGDVYRKQGYRAVINLLEQAESSNEIAQIKRMSDDYGKAFRGAMVFKKGAKLTLSLGELIWTVLMRLIGALVWIATAVYLASRAILFLLRKLLRSYPHQAETE